MNDEGTIKPPDDWHCGGWEGAEREALRFMQRLTFEQKLNWLEEAQRLIAAQHGWEAALQPGGTLVKRRSPDNG